jgi:hypothetical protein
MVPIKTAASIGLMLARFTLAPGSYTLACGQEPGVTVVAGRTVSVDCDVAVP